MYQPRATLPCTYPTLSEGDSDITVDRYNVDGVMPWRDDGEDEVVWLVGGEDADVDVFIDAIEQPNEPGA